MSTTAPNRPPIAPQVTPAPPQKAIRTGRHPTTTAILMLLPALVLILVFLIVPIVLTFILAFTNARLISPEPARFIGFDNFVRLFGSDTFWASLRNTVIFAVVIVPFQSALALVLAFLAVSYTHLTLPTTPYV